MLTRASFHNRVSPMPLDFACAAVKHCTGGAGWAAGIAALRPSPAFPNIAPSKTDPAPRSGLRKIRRSRSCTLPGSGPVDLGTQAEGERGDS